MRVTGRIGRDDIAVVYTADMGEGRMVEFVESVQPPIPRDEKWVLIISTLCGCPVGCRFCDAGSLDYRGPLSRDDMLAQIDFLVKMRYPSGRVPVKKFKIQFARMGEPAFNREVLEVLEALPGMYTAPGLMPCISTIAPEGSERFFDGLMEIKKRLYRYRFQLQFSIHTTDERLRDWLMPVKKWSFEKISRYGEAFYDDGGRKITLNFALADGMPVEPKVLLRYFSPELFLIKITPVNPTYQAVKNKLSSDRVSREWGRIIERLSSSGYEVILSIGELEENRIGSNCGQYITACQKERRSVRGAYSYRPQRVHEEVRM
ncbi:MAG: radical SAM protein [Thermoplasmata archaeon]|nr:MAG: radical SAM protein [Thermoplasmata archaeon]RLF73063.1 MAG: radical SAM protein [Thermoplasmata archaeon]RLF75196.1 MAG: radical SAM protein [Thermoplasmata archaeon]HDD60104.1 radical SAM protein [Euryarchaeota archaeon]